MDGEEMDYAPWRYDIDGASDCVYENFVGGGWETTPCNSQHYTLCEVAPRSQVLSVKSTAETITIDALGDSIKDFVDARLRDMESRVRADVARLEAKLDRVLQGLGSGGRRVTEVDVATAAIGVDDTTAPTKSTVKEIRTTNAWDYDEYE